jgi:hypothetical protein
MVELVHSLGIPQTVIKFILFICALIDYMPCGRSFAASESEFSSDVTILIPHPPLYILGVPIFQIHTNQLILIATFRKHPPS